MGSPEPPDPAVLQPVGEDNESDSLYEESSDELTYESLVGIPPMHHETGPLSYGQRNAWSRRPDGRRVVFHRFTSASRGTHSYTSEERSPKPGIKRGEIRERLTERGTGEEATARARLDRNEEKRRRMPAHLLPFIPYIEKSIDGPQGSLHWKKEGMIRIDIIREWIDTCESLHGTRCGTVTNSEPGSWADPLWLIDVENGCLVSTPPGAVYVALSYVWGEAGAAACTTISNLDILQERNGLYKDANMLPRVVRDAMGLVQSLEIPFIWVDRFCIVQDDDLAKQCQLNAMGSIYANARFTLVAAQNEDAINGLYGSDCGASDSFVSTRSETSTRFTDTEILLDQAMHLMRSKWYSRGWTLQEYLLSKRRVIFHNNTVNWECLCAAWHESQDMESVASVYQPQVEQPDDLECSPWPNMYRYARLVSLFNRRNLTFPEDVFDAFAGILSHLSRSFPGGFISGLPQMCFDAALLWQPWTTMTRRKSVRRSASDVILPSWSWAGWTGNMHSETWRSAANYLLETDDEFNAGQQCSWTTISTVNWTYSSDLTSKRREIRIPPAFAHPDFEAYKNGTLPSGWSVQSPADSREDVLYYHSCDPSHPFRYPIPIRDPHRAHIPPVIARYLHGTTTRGFLVPGPTYKSTASDCPAVELLTREGKWAGFLRLDDIVCADAVFDSDVWEKDESLIELIELSEGSVKNQPIEEKSFDEWNRRGCPRLKGFRENGLYKFVNVLWVEWAGDVVYRKALGRVEKAIWREVATERLDITLG
ncbi:HET-domain-containing protein [Lentithecium fluviatile CBS 122367]|uniref:HET-domain-containing protein n=1 Tax=Lentithecium fluviatile CBS 122367 TaxID=1168545 RepID=A0A6G1IKS8_9PLEO|nr:HET-domain-containing protein [Lentithecium fluviatile CBS 122367]